MGKNKKAGAEKRNTPRSELTFRFVFRRGEEPAKQL
jgi:hypothetical protein